MLFIVCNLIILILMITFYFTIEKFLSKSIFSNYSSLLFYKFYIAPLILFVINLFLFLVFSKELWFYSLIPLLLPLTNMILKTLKNKYNSKKYDVISNEITPKLIYELNKVDFDINSEDVSIVMYKQMNAKRVDITISSETKNDEILKKVIGVERKINNDYRDLVINLFLEKKTIINFGYI